MKTSVVILIGWLIQLSIQYVEQQRLDLRTLTDDQIRLMNRLSNGKTHKHGLRHRLKTRFWPFDKISYDVQCTHLNITHGIYDDDDQTVLFSCKCGFDLFYFGKSHLMNRILEARTPKQMYLQRFDSGWQCMDIKNDSCIIKTNSSDPKAQKQKYPLNIKIGMGYFEEDRKFILRYRSNVYKPFFEHLFTEDDFKYYARMMGTQDKDIICQRLCLGLQDKRVKDNLSDILGQVSCFGDSYID